MREIKFRAWDGKNMIMPCSHAYYQNYLSFCGNIVQKSREGMDCFGGGDRWSRVENLTLMQFTGLKDKNGVDIYEGDICQFDNEDLFIVKMSDWIEFYVEWIDEPECEDQARDFYRIEKSKIIGNIHQNPELL